MKKHLRFYCILLTCMLCSISAKAEFDTRVRYGIGNLYYYLDFSSMEAIIAPDNSYSGSLVIPEKLYSTFAFNATLHVPAESIDKYSSITPWDNFGSIVPLTGQELAIKNIGAYDNIAMSASANGITISGLRDGEVCSLYSLSGSKLDQATAANGSVSLCAKGQSVVVVRIGSRNMKMIIK